MASSSGAASSSTLRRSARRCNDTAQCLYFGFVVIAATFGVVCAIPWGRKLGAIMGAMVFSH
jgi:hypothetical protein